MTTRAKGPLSGLDWLKRGLNSGRHNPRAVFGGAAVLMVAALLPSLVQALVQFALRPGVDGTLVIAALTTLLSIALMGPLMGGYLRLLHACEMGRPVHARDIFEPFRSPRDARRMMGFAFVLLMVYLGVGYVLVSLFAKDLPEWYLQLVALSQQPQTPGQPVQLPPPPDGLGGFLGLGSLFALFIGGVFAVGMGQIALRARGIGAALADGVSGAAKNLLPLLVLAVLAFGLMMALSVLLALVLGVVALLASLLHPVLATAILLPVYLLLFLVLYVVMFGVMYHLWRDIAAEVSDAGGFEA